MDHIHPHPFLTAGHKGLFFDRLDQGVSDLAAQGAAIPPGAAANAVAETPSLVPFARGLYHVRNRTYIPGGGSVSQVGLESISPTGPPTNPWSTFALNRALRKGGTPDKPINAIFWVFFKSPVTKEGGPSDAVRKRLQEAGIQILECRED